MIVLMLIIMVIFGSFDRFDSLLLVCRKNVSGAVMFFARFGKQHINLVNKKIDDTSCFITGGLNHARNSGFKFQPPSYEY
jgi:hypothetical protein